VEGGRGEREEGGRRGRQERERKRERKKGERGEGREERRTLLHEALAYKHKLGVNFLLGLGTALNVVPR
jgi:hypothetical protein